MNCQNTKFVHFAVFNRSDVEYFNQSKDLRHVTERGTVMMIVSIPRKQIPYIKSQYVPLTETEPLDLSFKQNCYQKNCQYAQAHIAETLTYNTYSNMSFKELNAIERDLRDRLFFHLHAHNFTSTKQNEEKRLTQFADSDINDSDESDYDDENYDDPDFDVNENKRKRPIFSRKKARKVTWRSVLKSKEILWPTINTLKLIEPTRVILKELIYSISIPGLRHISIIINRKTDLRWVALLLDKYELILESLELHAPYPIKWFERLLKNRFNKLQLLSLNLDPHQTSKIAASVYFANMLAGKKLSSLRVNYSLKELQQMLPNRDLFMSNLKEIETYSLDPFNYPNLLKFRKLKYLSVDLNEINGLGDMGILLWHHMSVKCGNLRHLKIRLPYNATRSDQSIFNHNHLTMFLMYTSLETLEIEYTNLNDAEEIYINDTLFHNIASHFGKSFKLILSSAGNFKKIFQNQQKTLFFLELRNNIKVENLINSPYNKKF